MSRFWDIIDTARTHSRSGKPFDQALVDYLATCTQQDILQYQERFDEVHGALYRWDVWAAAYLIGRGCSDDSFIDFRAGLIAEGREWYHKVAVSPDSLADHPAVASAMNSSQMSALFYEAVTYAAPRAFERVTGDYEGFYDAWSRYRGSREPSGLDPAGEDFDFDDAQQMRRNLPRLAALCLPGGST